jgi:hypothetical protein
VIRVLPRRRAAESDRLTWAERLRNLYDVYVADRAKREVRLTAIGWKPDESYVENMGETASGSREWYKIIRKGRE